MGWLTDWFRRRTEAGTTPPEAPIEPVRPLAGEAPDRRSTRGTSEPVRSDAATIAAATASTRGAAAAAAAAAGGAVVVAAEWLRLTADPAEKDEDGAAKTDEGGGRHDGGSATSGSDGDGVEPAEPAAGPDHAGTSGDGGAPDGADGGADGGGDGGA